jgi:hypothetical protein
MKMSWIFFVAFASNTLALDTLYTNPYHPPLVYQNGEYDFYKYTPKYVPDNLLHCFKILGTCDSRALERFISRDEEEVVERGIFDRGYRMRKEFCLEGYSSFTGYFHKIGIFYPHAMESYILLSFHQYLNKEKISWRKNKKRALEFAQKENRLWKKRMRSIHKPVKTIPVYSTEEVELTEEDLFFQW